MIVFLQLHDPGPADGLSPVIRHAECSHGPCESHRNAALSYPYAIEHDGHLYVGYSNNGGNVGRAGSGRELANNNSAELAIIPLEKLR